MRFMKPSPTRRIAIFTANLSRIFPISANCSPDAYTRLAAMKLFSARAIDYMRSASAQDRRYLLYNPLVKMKVTTQGEGHQSALGCD
ncbi:MAG: hypothetical protein R2941_16930 [Desulfobacterales bacterium]